MHYAFGSEQRKRTLLETRAVRITSQKGNEHLQRTIILRLFGHFVECVSPFCPVGACDPSETPVVTSSLHTTKNEKMNKYENEYTKKENLRGIIVGKRWYQLSSDANMSSIVEQASHVRNITYLRLIPESTEHDYSPFKAYSEVPRCN